MLYAELDCIALKCLEKDLTRHYAAASGPAEVIERSLHEEAVLTRPPSRCYRLQKLVHRNRMVSLVGALAPAALLAGTVTSTLFWLNEARQRKEVEQRERSSRIALLVTQRRFEEADKLLAGIPANRPSIEHAAELRALGDWHATQGRWPEAVERFSSLVTVNQLDGSEVTSLDQLRLAAALLQAGDRDRYEQWRRSTVATFTPSGAMELNRNQRLLGADAAEPSGPPAGRLPQRHGPGPPKLCPPQG